MFTFSKLQDKMYRMDKATLCDFCFVFIFFYLPMLSALLLVPLIRPFLSS